MNDLVNHKKPNIDEDAIEKFFNYMISETEYCAKVIEREFNKPLVMTRKDHEDFKSSTKCQICKKAFEEGKLKVNNDNHIIRKN